MSTLSGPDVTKLLPDGSSPSTMALNVPLPLHCFCAPFTSNTMLSPKVYGSVMLGKPAIKVYSAWPSESSCSWLVAKLFSSLNLPSSAPSKFTTCPAANWLVIVTVDCCNGTRSVTGFWASSWLTYCS